MTPDGRRTTFISPILVGRDDVLGLADGALEQTRSGNGRLLLIAGEAGIGKTRLLGAVARRADLTGIPSVAAAAFPGDLELAGGLLTDLVHDLARHRTLPGAGEIGRRMEDLISGGEVSGRDGDAHRRRRLLVLDLADLVASLAGDGPVAVLLEDVHWADELSLEVLAHLARRLGDLPILVAATYRSDEVYGRVPIRDWRTRLLTARLAEEVQLARLSRSEVATMTGALLGLDLPVAADVIEALVARCDGIPLHIEEFLGSLRYADPTGDQLRTSGVPATLADAVIRRAESLSADGRTVADAASVVGREFDTRLLAEVMGRTPVDLDRAMTELIDRHFIVRTAGSDRLDFRHALIRDALRDAVPDGARQDLHRRIASAATGRPEIGGDAFLSMHYAGALMGEEAYRFARSAGQRAAALSSHREAAELFDRALRATPPETGASDRAADLVAFATEAAAIDDNVAADGAFAKAREILVDAGDPIGAARITVAHVAIRHLLGDDLATRAAMFESARDEIDAAGAAAVEPIRAALEAGLSAAYMLDRRLDESIRHGETALRLARQLGDVGAEIHSSTTLGAVFVFAGRMDEGWRLLEEAVGRAVRARLEAEAARAYRMIGSSASALVEYDRAEAWLRDGMEYARQTELWNHHHYMASHLAHVAWATGRWDLAQGLAERALSDGRGGITTRITALHVRGFVALGRARWSSAVSSLEEAHRLGQQMNELQRLSPALWGLAELADLQGDHEESILRCEDGLEASERVRDSAYAFPFLVTGARALLAAGDPLAAERWVERVAERIADRRIPGTLAAVDHGRGLIQLARGSTGRARTALEAAAAAWKDRGRTWEGIRVQVDLARCAIRSNRPADAARHAGAARDEATRIGAAALVGEAQAVLRSLGGGNLAAEPWSPLTAREFEVARLVAEGGTNPEIAAELGLSPKTVSAHVEHILDKLSVQRRAEIAAWVASRPVLRSRPPGLV